MPDPQMRGARPRRFAPQATRRDRSQFALSLVILKPGHSFEPPKDIANMTAENSSVGVKFVHDHVFKILKELNPFGMMGKNSGVQHIRIGKDDSGFFSDSLTHVTGSVSIISVDSDPLIEVFNKFHQLGHLILGQCLGRKKVERP